jgi:hypothetical protein
MDVSPVSRPRARPRGPERGRPRKDRPVAPAVGHVAVPSLSHPCGCNIGAFIVSRGASFINTCTNIILGRVMASSNDRAVTSDTLLPLFASS